MSHDVFISYASEDRKVAYTVCDFLESGGIHCWIAPRNILPGREYAESIMEGIEGCRLLLLIHSAETNASPHVRREVERAVSWGLSVLTIRIDNVQFSKTLEYLLSCFHWLDASGGFDSRQKNQLMQNVVKLLQRPQPPDGDDTFNIEHKTPSPEGTGNLFVRKAVLPGALILLVLMLSVLFWKTPDTPNVPPAPNPAGTSGPDKEKAKPRTVRNTPTETTITGIENTKPRNDGNALHPVPSHGQSPSSMRKTAKEPKTVTSLRAEPLSRKIMTSLTIRTYPQGADIYIDESFRGKAPKTLLLETGSHVVRVASSGYQNAEKRIDLDETMEYPLVFTLKSVEKAIE